MLSSPFFRRLFLPYLLLTCIAVAAVGFVAALTLRASYLEHTRYGMQNQIALIVRLISGDLKESHIPALDKLTHDLFKETGTRVTLIAADGKVLADSEAEAVILDNHLNRPEIQEAKARGDGSQLRESRSLHTKLLYVAQKIDLDGQTYYVRLAAHVTKLNEALTSLYIGLGMAVGVAVTGAALSCYFFARRHSRPILELIDFANALARAELNRRYLRTETGEVGSLAAALNSMADSLSRLLAQVHDDNEQLTTILTSMNEGVIATNAQQHVLWTNRSAGKLLGFEVDPVKGKQLWEVVRSDIILKTATEVLANGSRKTFAVGPLAGRHLEVTACTFPPGSASPEGLILVAHDTTQSVQYQELRKEFVANVSHELRTPLSIIKGFAETLRDGALADPARAQHFLATIEKHADQLTNLVNDLLELSRLDSQPGLTRKGPVEIGQMLRRVGDLLLPAAQRKRHHLFIDAPVDLPSFVGNSDYLERAVTNLIDNAIKYTPEEGEIHASVRADGGAIVIEVRDNGIGIPREEVPRIFERFYRVDRSRSRELGGTGLGLSIVKHVAQVHGGTIEVTSTTGVGSSFHLRLPFHRIAGAS